MRKPTPLLDLLDRKATNSHGPIEAFKKLYYHLYSNSDSSRAERLFEDIAKLLLIKMLADRKVETAALKSFVFGVGSANDTLLPVLCANFPDLISPNEPFTVSDRLLRQGLEDLSTIDLVSAPASILGEAFQALVGPRLRGDRGQFFTPRTLISAMVQVADPKPGDIVVDPAAGTGGFLVETQTYRSERSPHARSFGRLFGFEKDKDLYRLGGAMLNVATKGVGSYFLANSLDMESLFKRPPIGPEFADIVLTNPPFGSKIGITEKAILKQFALGHAWAFSSSENRWHEQPTVRPSQDPQLLFLELCLRILKPGGMCGIVLPEGVFGNRKTGYVWDFVRGLGTIEAMIDCPRTTFQPGTDTKTNVVFVRKNLASPQEATCSENVWIAVAKDCGHDRRGRIETASGEAIPDDFKQIGASFQNRTAPQWAECRIADPYYVVPRFHNHNAEKAIQRVADEWDGTVASVDDCIRAKWLSVRKGHEVGAEAYGGGEIPFVRTSDISNWEVSVNPTNGISEEFYEEYRRSQNLAAGDILLVVDGRYKIGRTAILHEHNCKCVVQSHFRILTVTKRSPVSCFELLYLLNLPPVLEQMRNLVFIQSTLGSIGKRLGQLLLPIPAKSARWENCIREFSEGLKTRANLLQALQRFHTPEPEL